MTQLANEHNAINLAQGFPTFEPDPRLLARITHHLQNGANQYAPMAGVDQLRESIAEKVQRLYGRNVDSDQEVTVSDGATEGLFSTILAVVRPGDEVIIFDPAFDSYAPAVILAGGQPRHLPLQDSPTRPGQHIDYDQLRDTINERTRLIIINFPHNPSGSILNRDDLDTLAEIVRDTSIFLLSDEVYEHIVFDGEQHCSVLTHDELWERSFVVTSFGKTYHATGWKIGYCIAPAALSVEFRRVHQFACYAVVTPIQHALADFMREAPNHYAELSSFYQKKRDHFCNLIKDSRFNHKPAAGTFFQTLDYSEISNESELSYAQRLTREIGVAAIPISVFCKEEPASRVLRFCFAKDDAILEEAAERLCRL